MAISEAEAVAMDDRFGLCRQRAAGRARDLESFQGDRAARKIQGPEYQLDMQVELATTRPAGDGSGWPILPA